MKSSPESDRVYLAHMLECIARVQSYTAGGGLQFRSSQLIQDAVVRNLQVMAESSQRLSAAAKANARDIPWRSISGFRNLVVHDYLGLDLDVLWSVVAQDLEPLKRALQRLI